MVRLLMYSNEWDIEGIIVDRHPSSFANQTRARGRIRYGSQNPNRAQASFLVPNDASGKQIHIYLTATDNGSRKSKDIPDLSRYCRLVVDIQ